VQLYRIKINFTARYAAILIIKIGFLKARLRRAFKKPILLFSAPSALKTTKSVS
jgi:hypothetical protein